MVTPALSVEAVNAMLVEQFPGTGNVCVELGGDYAIAAVDVEARSIRPGGFVSGPTFDTVNYAGVTKQ